MEAVMQAGTTGKAFNFWLVDTIAPDQKTRNWYTGEETTVESKTSQRYFVDNLNGAAAGATNNSPMPPSSGPHPPATSTTSHQPTADRSVLQQPVR